MCFVTFLILFALTFVPPVENSNILFVTVSPSVSHQIVFQAVWKELSLRGHKVTVITPNPLNDPILTNLTEIDISRIYQDLETLVPIGSAKHLLKKPDFITVFIKDSIVTKLVNQLQELFFNYDNVQQFLAAEHQFDVAIIEWLFPTMAAFGAKYNCPIIGISSLGLPIPALDTVGNPAHPAYAPDHNLPIGRNMSFRERLMSALWAVYVRIYYHLAVLPREDALARKYLGDHLPYLGDIERNVSLILANRNPILHRIYPTVPAIIDLGGIQLNKTKQGLGPELQRFLDSYNNGVIYFSLGSNMRSTLLPEEIRDKFLQTFAHLPYGVVWKWENSELPGQPSNVFIQKWFPQNEVLAHKNVKLFISQGGLQSMQDTINNHVPIIGFPTHSDQTSNIDTCVNYGIGIGLDFEDFTVETLNSSIYKIMKNNSYYENIIEIQQLMKDEPVDGLTKAVWWIEYVLRNKGAKHLISPSRDISWLKYFMLDVIAFLIIVSFILLFTLYKCIGLIVRTVIRIIGNILGTPHKKKNE